jgi:hypothetical protein
MVAAGGGSRAQAARRPFWVHQVAEYVIGLVLVSAGWQSLSPAVPTVAGGAIVLNAALVAGPLGAWRAFSRRQHRAIDVALIAGLAVVAVLPFVAVDPTSRLLMIGSAALMGFFWSTTDFAEPRAKLNSAVARSRAERPESIGRAAGRLVNRSRSYARSVKDQVSRD